MLRSEACFGRKHFNPLYWCVALGKFTQDMCFDTVTTSFECITRDAKVNASLVGLENSALFAIVIFSVILLFNKKDIKAP